MSNKTKRYILLYLLISIIINLKGLKFLWNEADFCIENGYFWNAFYMITILMRSIIFSPIDFIVTKTFKFSIIVIPIYYLLYKNRIEVFTVIKEIKNYIFKNKFINKIMTIYFIIGIVNLVLIGEIHELDLFVDDILKFDLLSAYDNLIKIIHNILILPIRTAINIIMFIVAMFILSIGCGANTGCRYYHNCKHGHNCHYCKGYY